MSSISKHLLLIMVSSGLNSFRSYAAVILLVICFSLQLAMHLVNSCMYMAMVVVLQIV